MESTGPVGKVSMRVAIYLRISKDLAKEELGVERQREDCLRYISSRPGWTLARDFTDNDVSATKLAKPRPQFERMLKAVEAGEIDVILSYHLDRLLRRLSELERVFTICQNAGAHIVTVADGVDTSNDGGRLVARILASVAQGEVERKSARQKRAMRQLAERGKGWGGRAFGYKADDTGLVAKEANAIRRAYTQILAGDTLFSIATDWNLRGLRTTKRGGNLWRGGTVKLVLINPRYAGLRAHNGEIVGKGNWPAIIDEEVWHSVSAILKDPGRNTTTPIDRSRKYLLSGLLFCGECGKKMSVGGGPKRRIYACKNMGCYRVARDMHSMDTLVKDVITARLSRPDAATLFIRPETDMRELYEELKAKHAKLTQIGLDYADDMLTREQARAATTKIETRIDELERQIAANVQSDDFSDFDPATDIDQWWDALPLNRKRALISMLCTITVSSVGRGWKEAARFHGVAIQWRVDDQPPLR